MSDVLNNFPPVVYVPTTSLPDEDGNVHLEMMTTADSRVALFVYSAIATACRTSIAQTRRGRC